MMDKNKVFETLNSIDVNAMCEQKSGKTYLSWAHAWSEVKKKYPDAQYEVEMFDGFPYIYDELTGYMCFVNVTIDGLNHRMWLAVMDGANNAMKADRYSYKVKEWENGRATGKFIDKWVEPATMFDINKTIMRCLVKALAMHGLGLYIYAGEDMPAQIDIDPMDLMGLSPLQIFKKYHISMMKANDVLVKASACPFTEIPVYEKLSQDQIEYLQRPQVVQWLANVAGK
jgi:hypothetical protein